MEYIYGLRSPIEGIKWLFCHETDSTMETAQLISPVFQQESFVLRTDYQRKGRGRKPQRSWIAQPGENLLCTYAIPRSREQIRVQLLPLAAGAAVLRVLSCWDIPGRLQLKWPNDILIDHRKTGGILCESRRSHVLIGIGLNVNQQSFQEGYFWEAASLYTATGKRWKVAELMEGVIAEIIHCITETEERLVEDINRYLYALGEPVRFAKSETEVISGIITGIQEDGALCIAAEDADHVCYSGEIVNRGRDLEK